MENSKEENCAEKENLDFPCLNEFCSDDPKIKLPQIEIKIIFHVEKIKNQLTIQNPNVVKCLEIIMIVRDIIKTVNQIMLIKNPNLIETFARLSSYKGDLENWSLSHEETLKFIESAAKIRKIASDIFDDCKKNFNFQGTKIEFWHFFRKIANTFLEKTKNFSADFISKLCYDYEVQENDKMVSLILQIVLKTMSSQFSIFINISTFRLNCRLD